MSTNKCPKGGVVTRTAGQAGFVSNTFYVSWGMASERWPFLWFITARHLIFAIPMNITNITLHILSFWRASCHSWPIIGKSTGSRKIPWSQLFLPAFGMATRPIPQAISGLLCLQGFFGCNLSWQRLEVPSRTWISKYQNLEEFKISKKCAYESTYCKKSKHLHIVCIMTHFHWFIETCVGKGHFCCTNPKTPTPNRWDSPHLGFIYQVVDSLSNCLGKRCAGV